MLTPPLSVAGLNKGMGKIHPNRDQVKSNSLSFSREGSLCLRVVSTLAASVAE